ncbi:MAG: ATP-binding protein, partial [Bacteroidales bacterium]|nr:ATP-binding protein [Bacteroidales bacterium]
RQSFIISKGFRNYFLYSLLFTIIEQVCIVVDMILVGNFVNADAFSALNLVVPVESIVTGLIMLTTGGAGIVASRCIGDQDFDRAFGALSVAVVSTLIIIALVSAMGLYFMDGIVRILCPEDVLAGYLRDYLGIYFLSLIPIALYSIVILLLNIDGKPAIALLMVASASALDIILDVVFMKYLGLGAKGVAFAGTASYTVPLFFLIPYLSSNRCSFKFMIRNGKLARDDFNENIITGIPYCLPYVIMCSIIFVINKLTLTKLGPFGLYVWGAGYQVLSLIIVTMDCIGGTILVIMGSMLVGSHDMTGFSIFAKRCSKVAAIVVGAMILVVMTFPEWTLSLFGYNLPSDLGNSLMWVRFIVLLGIPYTVCCLKIYVSQALNRKWISTVPLAIFFILTVGGFCLCAVLNPKWMFPSFLISGILFILSDFLACAILRRYLKGVSSYLLIPPQDSVKSKCISVAYSREGIESALPVLESFLDTMGTSPATIVNVNLCCEELMLSIVDNNAGKKLGEDWFFDVFVLDDEDEIKVTVKDAGSPFNPVRKYTGNAVEAMNSGEDMELSLRLVNRICKEFKYNYMYGQNTIYLSFAKA